jgi:hypothetical protein
MTDDQGPTIDTTAVDHLAPDKMITIRGEQRDPLTGENKIHDIKTVPHSAVQDGRRVIIKGVWLRVHAVPA